MGIICNYFQQLFAVLNQHILRMVWLKINAPGKSEFHYIGKFENLLISELESELQQFLACLTSSVTTPILFIAYEMGPEAAGIPVIEWNYPSDSDILGGMMGSARVRKILFLWLGLRQIRWGSVLSTERIVRSPPCTWGQRWNWGSYPLARSHHFSWGPLSLRTHNLMQRAINAN